VLEEQQLFGRFAGTKSLDSALLQMKSIVIRNKSQPSSFAYPLALW